MFVMAIDGHALGFDGTYRFRGDDRLMFKHLVSSKHVGETIKFEILRDGKKIEIIHKTGAVKPSIGLFHNRDVLPEYYLMWRCRFYSHVITTHSRAWRHQSENLVSTLRSSSPR